MSPPANTDPISSSLVEKVLEQAQDTASHSWEYGVVFEALLEYHNPSLTVFHTPVAQQKQPLVNQESDVAVLDYIKQHIRTDSSTLCEGNGSSSDPSSLGIPALLLSHSSPDSSHYLSAAQRQLTTLLTSTPRLPDGAISHRTAIASAWSDFVYMAPPFLAYYGVYTDDEQLVRESVRQCRLYSEILATESGLWKHIVSASDEKKGPGERKDDDVGFWSTGNGWAAAGMARVLATIRQSKLVEQMQKEQKVLVEMIGGIVRGAMATDTDPSLLLRNYLGDETWWGEVAGTALLAAATFRMVVLEPGMFGKRYTDWALQKMIAVRRHINTETGIAAPVINALTESQRTPLDGVNPESQAFVVLMYAAWRDWKTQNA